MNDGIIIEVGMIHKLKELGVTNAAVIMLYGKILTMSEDTGYCTATNTYFADLLAKTPRGIQKYILELKTRGIIRIETEKTYDEDGHAIETRMIYPQISM